VARDVQHRLRRLDQDRAAVHLRPPVDDQRVLAGLGRGPQQDDDVVSRTLAAVRVPAPVIGTRPCPSTRTDVARGA